MRNRFAIAALAATVLALPAQSARADVGSGSGCGGALYTMCAAWSLTFDGTYYTLSVTNTSNAPVEDGEIKEIGLGNATAGSFTISKVGDWGVWDLGNVQGNPFSGMGMINLVLLAGTSGNNTLGTGSTVNLQFSVTGTGFDIEQIGFHEISGPNGCSTKSVFALTGAGQTGTPLGEGSEACGSTTIPEPSTVVLLGTGIVGILAARRRRRTTEN